MTMNKFAKMLIRTYQIAAQQQKCVGKKICRCQGVASAKV